MPKYSTFDIEASWATEPYFYRAPHYGQFEPMPYQHAGVEYRLRRQHGLFGDAPGLGKSAESILFGNAIDAEYTLIVCPASLRLNWEREVWMWSKIENVSTYPVLKASDGVSLKHNYVIISYNMLNNPNIFAALMDERWDHLILDEAHALKDPYGNTRTKAICGWYSGDTHIPGLAEQCDRITMATGTLMPNQPKEAYNAIRLLNWEAINCASLRSFEEAYYALGEGWVVAPKEFTDPVTGQVYMKRTKHWSDQVRNVPVNLDDLQHRLRKHIMVRRLKPDVLTQLPPKQWHVFPLSTTGAMRKAMRHPGWKAAQKLYELDPSGFDTTAQFEGEIGTARRELGEAKAPSVAEYCIELLESGAEKIVVGAWHHSVIDVLVGKLGKFGVVTMTGKTTPGRKQQAVDLFQGDERVRVIVGQMGPLGEGWTLTKAQDVVFAEPDWVPGKNDQLLDRINRMGQKGDYTIGHIPVVPDSLDERILGTAIRKDQNIYLALDHRA